MLRLSGVFRKDQASADKSWDKRKIPSRTSGAVMEPGNEVVRRKEWECAGGAETPKWQA